ncbi:hypothetical protein DO97_13600 [Neosynechococcus sphagnicola sy1]|uniref:DUF2141 domain-containing protein n=1 Tax=Neosynechococcus sphagnicola sy1 TaxID=1497020 RepID=A0A098TMI0_9CYAN|nr:DUF2141 domain-containing protein [Neosynechococcus sphagnicola]KGF72048.1 hypothetical protein DO97_13600 [Neosynechococcus sphagnicola sy1]
MVQQFSASFLLLVAVSHLMLTASASAAANSNLRVTISGLKNQQGQVCLSLFSSQQGFPGSSERAVQARCLKVAEIPMVVQFQNLPPGSYAIAVFHDANGDNILNRNGLGIPTEEFGFSQNPGIFAGPPKFGDSQVLVFGPETNIQVRLRSLFQG